MSSLLYIMETRSAPTPHYIYTLVYYTMAAYVLWCYRVLRSCVLIVARLFYAEHGDAVYYTVKGIGRALRVYVFYRARLCRLAARCILYR